MADASIRPEVAFVVTLMTDGASCLRRGTEIISTSRLTLAESIRQLGAAKVAQHLRHLADRIEKGGQS